ncbi:MAG: hypothetical protein SangKO_066900 [Sandaracinaceae bacterium]
MDEHNNELSDRDLETLLAEAIELLAAETEHPAMDEGVELTTFENAGVLTDNRGLVIEIGDAEFQVSIVRSR